LIGGLPACGGHPHGVPLLRWLSHIASCTPLEVRVHILKASPAMIADAVAIIVPLHSAAWVTMHALCASLLPDWALIGPTFSLL
jgi:hypothetical protein